MWNVSFNSDEEEGEGMEDDCSFQDLGTGSAKLLGATQVVCKYESGGKEEIVLSWLQSIFRWKWVLYEVKDSIPDSGRNPEFEFNQIRGIQMSGNGIWIIIYGIIVYQLNEILMFISSGGSRTKWRPQCSVARLDGTSRMELLSTLSWSVIEIYFMYQLIIWKYIQIFFIQLSN